MTDTQIKTEALRIAREMVKAAIRKQGVKLSSFAVSDVTAKAKAILAEGDSDTIKRIMREAKRIVKIRSEP